MCGFISLKLKIYEELTGKVSLRLAPPTCHRRAERMKKFTLKVFNVYLKMSGHDLGFMPLK